MWNSVDTWWESFVGNEPMVRAVGTTRTLDNRWFTGEWTAVDPWWEEYAEPTSLVQVDATTTTLDSRVLDGAWNDLDPWWTAFAEVRDADVADLQGVLKRSNREWERSDSRFDLDPLATDWTPRPDTPGPLRPNQEENWSQWLAHLLRNPPDGFLAALFSDDNVNADPEAVRREVHFPDPTDSDRYADILVYDDNQSISIEVKWNDEHYWKTLHTTALIEADDTRTWQHFLLVPKYKQRAVRQTFGDNISDPDDGRAVISVAGYPAITILYWRDISTALRTVLMAGEVRNSHWAASAYLFCTLIEQKILQLIPATTVDQIAASDDVIHMSQTLSVATGGVDEQLQYLRRTLETNNE
jgi:hypothetical protein